MESDHYSEVFIAWMENSPENSSGLTLVTAVQNGANTNYWYSDWELAAYRGYV
jgi:hypothetical protein